MKMRKLAARAYGDMPKLVAQAIQADIEDGVLKPGEKLPGVVALAEHYGVADKTVRRGYALIDHLLGHAKGKGTWVK